jgi:hypothetical protein
VPGATGPWPQTQFYFGDSSTGVPASAGAGAVFAPLHITALVRQPGLRCLGYSEIDYLRHEMVVLDCDQDVRRFEVAMNDPAPGIAGLIYRHGLRSPSALNCSNCVADKKGAAGEDCAHAERVREQNLMPPHTTKPSENAGGPRHDAVAPSRAPRPDGVLAPGTALVHTAGARSRAAWISSGRRTVIRS